MKSLMRGELSLLMGLGQLLCIASLLCSSKTGWDQEQNTGRGAQIILGLEANLSSSGHPRAS